MNDKQGMPHAMSEMLAKGEQGDTFNPLVLLGIEAWVLRSLPSEDLTKFLRDYKKLASKYFHPDVCRDELRKQAHEYYFKRLMSAMDCLLKDEGFLMLCLDELEESAFERMRSRIVKLDSNLRACRQELAKNVRKSDGK